MVGGTIVARGCFKAMGFEDCFDVMMTVYVVEMSSCTEDFS